MRPGLSFFERIPTPGSPRKIPRLWSLSALSWLSGALAAQGGCMAETPVCVNIESDAQRLIESVNSCESDEDCQILSAVTKIPDACFPAFHCSIALRKDLNEADFLAKANKLSKKYKFACSECETAKCSTQNIAVSCAPLTKRCKIDYP